MSMNCLIEVRISILIVHIRIDKNLIVLKSPILIIRSGPTSIMNVVQSSHDIGPRIIISIVVRVSKY